MPTKRTSKPPMRTPKQVRKTRTPPTDAMESLGDAIGLKGLRRVTSDTKPRGKRITDDNERPDVGDPIDMLGPLIDPIIEEDDDDDSPNVVETP